MNELTPLLKELADKLGTTVEHLWMVMVHQARIYAIQATMLYVLFGVAIFCWWHFAIRPILDFHKKQQADKNKYYSSNYDPVFPQSVAAVALGTILLICLPFAITELSVYLSSIFNPEYWALSQILHALKPISN